MPGVRLIATGEDLAKLCKPWVGTLDHFRGMKSSPQSPLAIGKVVWAGQAVVAVVAETRALAEDAAEQVQIEFRELEAVTDIDAGREATSIAINPEQGDNVSFRLKIESGDADKAFANATETIDLCFLFGRHTPVTLEPRAIIANYDLANPS